MEEPVVEWTSPDTLVIDGVQFVCVGKLPDDDLEELVEPDVVAPRTDSG